MTALNNTINLLRCAKCTVNLTSMSKLYDKPNQKPYDAILRSLSGQILLELSTNTYLKPALNLPEGLNSTINLIKSTELYRKPHQLPLLASYEMIT